MVKQAERQVKRSPLLPIFGLIIAIGLGVVAWFGSDLLIQAVPQLKSNFGGVGQQANVGHIAIAIGLWLAMLALAFFLVALLTGKDPESAKGMKLPPREVKKKRY
jgi:hypothetical protein